MGRKNHRGVLLSVVMSVGGAWGDQGVEIGELSTPRRESRGVNLLQTSVWESS